MTKEQIEILTKIIEHEGSCDWSSIQTCMACPMSKLKKKPNGTWYSCMEALDISGLTSEEANLRYMSAAKKILLDYLVERDILEMMDEQQQQQQGEENQGRDNDSQGEEKG